MFSKQNRIFITAASSLYKQNISKQSAAAASYATFASASPSSNPSRGAPFYNVEHLRSFETFNKMGAKFRVAVTNKCNMNCFFCHNEGMKNPRTPGSKVPLAQAGEEAMSAEQITQLMNDFCDLKGTQLNITGGEPLARKDIISILRAINKRQTRVILNSNVLLADRLLKEPKLDVIDAIYASLHTTKEEDFKAHLGIGGGAKAVMQNMVKLQEHGYRVQINYSLGAYNLGEFGSVLDFAQANSIDLKAITLIRSTELKDQYGTHGEKWTNPEQGLAKLFAERGLQKVSNKEGFGGFVTTYKISPQSTHEVVIKNVGKGRLATDFCNGCKHSETCGEGIYAMRSGVDALWKPCLLNNDKFEAIQYQGVSDYKPQILAMVHKMVGNWQNHRFVSGAPK